MNKAVGRVEKQKTARRKQETTCRLCKGWKAKLQTPATTFTTAKHCRRSVIETALSLSPLTCFPTQEKWNDALGWGVTLQGENEKAELDWPTVT